MNKKLMLKRAAAIATILVLVVSMAACGGGSKSEAGDSDTIYLGVNYELTGDNPIVGESAGKGIDMALEEINAAGGITIGDKAYKLDVKKLDNEFKAESAAIVAQKFADDDSIVAMIGPNDSAMCLGCQSVVETEGLPTITPWATQVDITSGDYFFRACFTDDFQGQVLAKYAYDFQNCKTAAVLYDMSNDYCVGIATQFRTSYEEMGGKVLEYQSYNSGETDYSAQLTKIMAKNPEIILLPNFYSQVVSQAEQAASLGYKGKFMGSDTWGDSLILELDTNHILEGSVWCGHYAEDIASDKAKTFIAAFREKYGADTTPNDIAALNYDTVYLLYNAITAAQSTERDAVRDALKNADMYEGVTGNIKFNDSGDPSKPAVMIQIVDGKFKYLDTVQP